MIINSAFDIAKNDIFNNFLYNEVAKRHIEEKRPDLFSMVNLALDSFHNYEENHENILITVVQHALDIYRQIRNHRLPVTNPLIDKMVNEFPEIFNFEKFKKPYDFLLKISSQYNIFATLIPFPVDMEDVINNFSQHFTPPVFYLIRIVLHFLGW